MDVGGSSSQLHDSLTRSTSIVLGDSANANAIDVVGSQLPGILEEAAILFSNAQYEAAKLTLEAALQESLPAGYTSLACRCCFLCRALRALVPLLLAGGGVPYGEVNPGVVVSAILAGADLKIVSDNVLTVAEFVWAVKPVMSFHCALVE